MKEVTNNEQELTVLKEAYNKKHGYTHKNCWVWKSKMSDFYDHPILDDAHPVKGEIVEPRIEISVSNSGHDVIYLSCYFEGPLDSWGANWDITDSGCFSLKEEEVDKLIEKLQEAKKVMNLKKKSE